MSWNRRVSKRAGQVLVIVAVAILGLVAMAGLAVDGGVAYSERRHAQSIADSIAYSAAMAKIGGKSNWRDVALQIGAQNGYDSTNSQIAINNPPSTQDCQPNDSKNSPYVGNEEYIQVVVRTRLNTYFMPIVGIRDVGICVEAVARAKARAPLFGGYGMVATAPDKVDYEMAGSFHLTVKESNLFSNSSGTLSSDTPSLRMAGDPRIYLDPGYRVDLAGGGQASICAWCTPIPTVQNGAPQYTDAQLEQLFSTIPTPPAPPTCSGNGTKNDATKTVTPGNFPSGLDIGGSGTWTFQSGVYCISGGRFHVGSIASVNASNSDVIIVAGDNNVDMDGGTVFYFKSLEVYTNNGNWTITGGADLYTNKVRYISTGSGILTVASDTDVKSLSNGVVPDAFFYFRSGKFSWDAGAVLWLHAPTEGNYAGLLVYLPWSNVGYQGYFKNNILTCDDKTGPCVEFIGGTNYNLTGTFLMPHTTVHIGAGNMTNAFRAQFIAYRYLLDGGASLMLQYSDPDVYHAPQATVELAQ